MKKSRFIAIALPVADRAAALRGVQRCRVELPDANHHCWAYLLGDPGAAGTAAHSDDGEPSGTAGKPILNILMHRDVGDILVVVVRYFGGIKLGAGGLVRAYSNAAQTVMDRLPIRTFRHLHQFDLELGFALEQELRHFLGNHLGRVLSCEYENQVQVRFEIPQEQIEALESWALARQLTCRPYIDHDIH